MKTQARNMAKSAIVAALLASLAPVPAKSTIIPTTAVEARRAEGLVSTLTFNLESGQVFLPLAEAATYLSDLNDHKRRLLREAIDVREAKGKGPLFVNTPSMVKVANENIEQCSRIRDAIRTVLEPKNLALHFAEPSERESFKADLIKFARAVAACEYIAEDILSAIEQCRPPKKTYQPENMPSAKDVKAMITAEHKRLGLSAPEFS